MRSGQVLFLGVAALLLGGAYRLAQIERTQGQGLRRKAARQQTATWTIPAQRGAILDCKGRTLAGTARRPSVFMDPTLIGDPRAAAASVAPALGLEPAQLERRIQENKHRAFVWVKRSLSDEELAAFNRVRREQKLRAFVVRYEPTRVYPYGRLAAQVLGFVGAEQTGLAGIEQAFNDVLRGRDGRGSSTVDARRRRVRSEADAYIPPRDGDSVVLAIDAHVQQRAEYHLRNAFEEFKPQWATAVVLDPQGGEVLAMVTLPDFDPAQPIPAGLTQAQREVTEEALRNRAIADSYEPGSVFKPFIAAPALDAAITRIDEPYAVNGPTRQFGPRTIHDVHAYGTLTLHQVISRSSNIGMGLLGARCGNERLYEFVRRFGFGGPTGIRLPGEHRGLLQDFSRWTKYSTQSIPIGQEIAVTPIQLVTAFSVFCNDGILYRPRIVRGVITAAGEIREDNSLPIRVRRVLAADVAGEFRERALVEVVRAGTGKRAQIADYQVFGKTGTAQVARPRGGGYIPGAYVSSFVGGAPAEWPRVAVLVTLYRPSSGKYYGGTVAAPAAAAIIADTLAYMPDALSAERSNLSSGGAQAHAR
ncbi:MAG: peptidoglycan D,D-transpeptidase FtsI family protein [Phycisphaerae bacterium]